MRTKNRAGRGRPRKRETAGGVADTRVLLAWLRTADAPSSVTGKRLNQRALAFRLWERQQERNAAPQAAGSRAAIAPLTDDLAHLERCRDDAIGEVRRALLNRLRSSHMRRVRKGEEVLGLQMSDPAANGPRVFPATGSWPGLPGLYSADWVTPVGGPGEVSADIARQVDADPAVPLKLVKLNLQLLEQAVARVEAGALDPAAVAEEVERRLPRGSDKGAPERFLRRLIREAERYEYVHLGSEEITGRQPLPKVR